MLLAASPSKNASASWCDCDDVVGLMSLLVAQFGSGAKGSTLTLPSTRKRCTNLPIGFTLKVSAFGIAKHLVKRMVIDLPHRQRQPRRSKASARNIPSLRHRRAGPAWFLSLTDGLRQIGKRMPMRGEMTLPNQVFEASYPHIEPSMLPVSANDGIVKGRQFLFDGNPAERFSGGLGVLSPRRIHIADIVHTDPSQFGAIRDVHVNTRRRSPGCRCRRTARHLA